MAEKLPSWSDMNMNIQETQQIPHKITPRDPHQHRRIELSKKTKTDS